MTQMTPSMPQPPPPLPGLETPEFTFDGIKGWCRLVDAYDADTLTIVMQYQNQPFKFRTRMYGIDACEINSKDPVIKAKALQARNRVLQLVCGVRLKLEKRAEVQRLLADNVCLLWIECMHHDKYGRILVRCRLSPDDPRTLADILIEEKLAYPYYGGTRLNEDEQKRCP
ncbi:hypothetical protein HK102_005524 [Quaeritorhiza haematococci]|nr:hypothetical protein HK102_005524 [Quaeritorhiza haematococci]